MDDITCDTDCSACCLIFDDNQGCGDCCDSCANCGDGCCLSLGDSFLCDGSFLCCNSATFSALPLSGSGFFTFTSPALEGDSSTTPAQTDGIFNKIESLFDTPALIGNPSTTSAQSEDPSTTPAQTGGFLNKIEGVFSTPAQTGSPIIIQSQPTATTMHSAASYDLDINRYRPVNHRRHCRRPSLKTVLVWLFVIAILAALGVTIWLTRNIPFHANCGNAHRALLGVLIAIVFGGIFMPVYYKYIQKDLIRKAMSPFDVTNGKRKKSVLASFRFRFTLMVATFILIVLIALGYYDLWSKENRCMDPSLWIVKGWFIALLLVAIVVMALTFSSMFRAARERRRTLVKEKSLHGRIPDSLDQNDTIDSGGVKMASASASLPFVSEAAPPDNAGSSSRSTSPPVQQQQQQQHQAGFIPDRIELAQINENLSEQLEWQQQQQRHQAQMDHSQAGYGLSGTGAYC